ncbi:MAG TPA: transcriptional repressor LexA, partial [Terriglobia bacterium]|nr:transcriptional repressor LexA [Terriglobia bacterium]
RSEDRAPGNPLDRQGASAMTLTKRQKQVLDFLVGFINRKGYSPSFEEVGRSLRLSSLATVHKHLGTLEEKGFIRRAPNRSRSVEVMAVPGPVPSPKTPAKPAGGRGRRDAVQPVASAPGGLGAMEFPLLGRIAAGQPVEAIPNPETFSFGDFAGSRRGVFVLRVKGDSMIDDHICDGDYILVEGAHTAQNGEIVVALVRGNDATLKRFFRERSGKVRLQPANAQMNAIILAPREVKIQGRVIGVLRKY